MKKFIVMMFLMVFGFVAFGDAVGDAAKFIKKFEGKVVDSQGMHVAYDDANPKNTWNGKEDIQVFIKKCSGKATIGYGCTNREIVFKGKITEEEAELQLRKNIEKISPTVDGVVRNACKEKYLNNNQKIALYSLIYNIGVRRFNKSALPKTLSGQDCNESIKKYWSAFKKVTKVVKTEKGNVRKKVVSKGLVNRRNEELKMFFKK